MNQDQNPDHTLTATEIFIGIFCLIGLVLVSALQWGPVLLNYGAN